MEIYGLENEESNERITLEDLVDQVANCVYRGEITNDNPSPKNNLTALDQLSRVVFEKFIDKTNTLESIKESILEKATNRNITEKRIDKDTEDDLEDDEDYDYDEYFDENDDYEEDMEDEVKEFSVNLDNPDTIKLLRNIAKHIVIGNITNDTLSVSIQNRLTSYEQIFLYYFGVLPYEDEDSLNEGQYCIEPTHGTIVAMVEDLRGGSYFHKEVKHTNFLSDELFKNELADS